MLFASVLIVCAIASSTGSEAQALLASGAAAGTCGLEPTTDPDCARHDMGSCGTACCGLRVSFQSTSTQLGQAISAQLARHGPDGAFTPAKTWGPWFKLDAGGCRDFTASTETTDQYLCQAAHATSGSFHFRDTVNIKIGATSPKGTTVVQFFSLSEIAGALGDAGQNFKNHMMIVRALEADGIVASGIHAFLGCGPVRAESQLDSK